MSEPKKKARACVHANRYQDWLVCKNKNGRTLAHAVWRCYWCNCVLERAGVEK